MIGLWIARYRDNRRLTLFHLVESEIATRKVTRCGRQLDEIEGTALAPVQNPPSSEYACYHCKTRPGVQ